MNEVIIFFVINYFTREIYCFGSVATVCTVQIQATSFSCFSFFLVLLTHSHTYMFSITFSPLFCLPLHCSWAFVLEGLEMRVLEVERLIGPQKGLKLMSLWGGGGV